MRKRLVFVFVLGLLAVATLACSAAQPAAPAAAPAAESEAVVSGENQKVSIKGFAFTPASVTVRVGQDVIWSHDEATGHTATGDNNEWDSGNLSEGKTFSHTFGQPGKFTYHCAIHPSMKGTVLVQ